MPKLILVITMTTLLPLHIPDQASEVEARPIPIVAESLETEPHLELSEVHIPVEPVVPPPKRKMRTWERPIKTPHEHSWKLSETDVEAKIRARFGKHADTAVKIARCESSLNPGAVGDKHIVPHSYGLFQIRALQGRPSSAWLLDVNNNVEYTYKMSSGGTNWDAWACSKKIK